MRTTKGQISLGIGAVWSAPSYSLIRKYNIWTSSSKLLAKLELEDLDLILRERRLRWFGHVECSSGAVKSACDIQIDGRRGAGRPKLTWKKLTEKDCRESRLLTLKKGALGDQVWDLLCMQLASYLEGGPLMWMMPMHLHVNKKSDYDDMMRQAKCQFSS